MGWFARLLGKVSTSKSSEPTEMQAYGRCVVSEEDMRSYYSGDKTECSFCGKELKVYLAERHSITTVCVLASPRLYAIQFDDFQNVKPFDPKVLPHAALRCVECSTVSCWDCSGKKGSTCPTCGCYGQPFWFTHLRTTPLYAGEYTSMYNYAVDLQKRQDVSAALSNYWVVLLFPRKNGDEAYSDGATILESMGDLRCLERKFATAIDCYRIALTIAKDAYGGGHPQTKRIENRISAAKRSV